MSLASNTIKSVRNVLNDHIAKHPAASGGEASRLELIEKKVLVANATQVDFTGLSIDDGNYMLVMHIFQNGTGSPNLSLYFNDDSAANYDSQYLDGTNTVVSAGRVTSGLFGGLVNVGPALYMAMISKLSGKKPVTNTFNATGHTALPTIAAWAHTWDTTSTITKITIWSPTANSIGIGSTFTLYKLEFD